MAVRVAIVGSRDYPRLADVAEFVAALPADAVVVSGAARGVDREAARAARARGLVVEVYPADWATYGKRAGFLRNQTIVDRSDAVIAFWDGQSRGTMHTVNLARAAGKRVVVHTFGGSDA